MKKIVFLLSIIVFISFIFWNSSKPSNVSNGFSKRIAAVVADFVIHDFNEMSLVEQSNTISTINNIIREIAHIIEFFVLGVLMTVFINKIVFSNKTLNGSVKMLIILSICFSFAFADEVFQIFIDGRTFQFKDIFNDLFGSTLGVLIVTFINKSKKH